jgi:glycosyltransferase involved in cell wall biosynthesis
MGPEGFLRKEDMGPHLADFSARALAEHRQWLESADVFHGHYWDGGVAALGASLALGKALVFTSHSLGILKRDRVPDPSEDESTFRYPLRIRAERRILHAVDRVIALSAVEREALVQRYGTDPGKIRIVPGGVDLAAFAPRADKGALKRQLGITTELLVFTVGRLDPRKGFVELVNAIPRVVRTLGAKGKRVTFALPVGPEDPSPEERAYRQAMLAAAQEHNVGEHIHWFHRLSDADLKCFYAAADVFACPSPYEPFGLVLVEAFAAGTPVVATCHGGPTEIVTPGQDGYLVEPSDAVALADRLVDVLDVDEGNREAMVAAAMAKARDRYAWPAVAGQIADVYAELLA